MKYQPFTLSYSLFYFPLWKGKFPRRIIPRLCPRRVRITPEPSLRSRAQSASSRVRCCHPSSGTAAKALPSTELSPAQHSKAWGRVRAPTRPLWSGASSLPARAEQWDWWLQGLLWSLLAHRWSMAFPGSKGSLPDPALQLVTSSPCHRAHTEHHSGYPAPPSHRQNVTSGWMMDASVCLAPPKDQTLTEQQWLTNNCWSVMAWEVSPWAMALAGKVPRGSGTAPTAVSQSLCRWGAPAAHSLYLAEFRHRRWLCN